MSIPGSAAPFLLAQQPEQYRIQRSLRFNSSDSAYLSRTPSVAGNRKTWTWAGWVKRSKLDYSYGSLFGGKSAGVATMSRIAFSSGNVLWFQVGGSSTYRNITSAVFRDPSAWYHVVAALDTTQATASDRCKLWVNGIQQAFATTSSPPLDYSEGSINAATEHAIGAESDNGSITNYFDGYLADVHFIDGQALDPTSFGEFDANGVWQPKAYTGSYPGNSFHLPFNDNSTAAALGTDTSGAGNNWTVNNISVAAGAGNDSLVDTPTSYGTDTSVGGEVRGNYATLNPLANGSAITLSNGNLDGSVSTGTGSNDVVFGTVGISSGKWYWEVTANTGSGGTYRAIGIGKTALNPDNGVSTGTYVYFGSGEKASDGGAASAYGASYANGDVIGVAFDADAGTLTFYKNGTTQGTAFTGLTAGPYVALVGKAEGALTWAWSVNFGQRPFAYPAPSGFKALCTTNLPDPVVAKPSEVMDVVTYTGNGSTQTISGLGFSPDFVWIKARSSAIGSAVVDSVRGSSLRLFTELTSAEDNVATVTSLNSDGFGVSTAGGLSTRTNDTNVTYAAWAWDAGSSTVTNTQGSITSQVRANASAGFSIVTYTGTGANGTVGHGLGVAPSMVLVKQRTGTFTWRVYHASLANTQVLYLSATDAATTETTAWNSTTPTSSVVSLGTSNGVNQSSSTYVAYCFAPVAGYSSFGSYTGNGSADGPFVFCGFRPRWILYKRSDAGTGSGNWNLVDTVRSTYNVSQTEVIANDSIAEFTSSNASMDILSNGFKIRTTDTSRNESAKTFVYAAFAESPFAYARAR